MRIRVSNTLDDLYSDMRKITVGARSQMSQVVKKNVRRGATLSRGFARQSAGSHGKHYPASIGSELKKPLIGEWGPDPAMPQGGMSFERGSRNQRPHLDLARSGDIVVPAFGDDVRDLVDDLFWPR